MDMYCRTCYRANGARKFDISALSQVTDVRIGDMLIYCLQIEISPYDQLPQKICEACLCALNSMFLFRKHCYFSDTELRKMLKYAPPQHLAAAPDMDNELSLVDVQQPDQTNPSESFDIVPEDPISSSDHPVPQTDSQDILPPAEDSSSLTEELAEKPVVVEKYVSKLFECEQCDYRSSFKCNIIRHQQCRDHTGIRITNPSADKAPRKSIKKLLCCGECGFQTIVRANFLRHQRVWKHTVCSTKDVEVNRILQKCPTCPHCGVQRANLQAHMAQWCRVLRAKKQQRRDAFATGGTALLGNVSNDGEAVELKMARKPRRRDTVTSAGGTALHGNVDNDGQPIELKIEIDNSSEMSN